MIDGVPRTGDTAGTHHVVAAAAPRAHGAAAGDSPRAWTRNRTPLDPLEAESGNKHGWS
jgi:hypothetical protein